MGRRALSIAAILLWLGAGVAFAILGVRSIRLERDSSLASARKLAQITVQLEASRLPIDVTRALVPATSEHFTLIGAGVRRDQPPTPSIAPDDRLILDQAAYLERAGDPVAAATMLDRVASREVVDVTTAIALLRSGAITLARGESTEATARLRIASTVAPAFRDPDGVPVAAAALSLLARSEVGARREAAIEALLGASADGLTLRADGGVDASDLLVAVAADSGGRPREWSRRSLEARFERAVWRARLGRQVLDALGSRGAGVVGDRVAYRSPEIDELAVTPVATVEEFLRRRTGKPFALVVDGGAASPADVPSAPAAGPLAGLRVTYPSWSADWGGSTGAGVALAVGLGLYALGGLFAILWFVRSARANRMQADFVAAVSHEMKTPIAGIQAMAEMLADGRVPDPARAHAYAERIRAEASRLGAGVRNVLDAARIERDPSSVVRPVPTEPSALVLDLASVLRPVLEGRGFRFTVHATPSRHPIPIDPDAFGSVVGNLLDNAAKFSTTTKEIDVDAGPVPNGYRVTVSDRGPGVPREERHRIFERFERGEHARKMAVPGVGLGLHVARNLVKAHGGTIEVLDREGGSPGLIRPEQGRGGAVFVVTWPGGASS